MYQPNYTRDSAGYCKLFGLEYKTPTARRWRKCSLTMHDAARIVEQAEALAKQDGWAEWRVVEVA